MCRGLMEGVPAGEGAGGRPASTASRGVCGRGGSAKRIGQRPLGFSLGLCRTPNPACTMLAFFTVARKSRKALKPTCIASYKQSWPRSSRTLWGIVWKRRPIESATLPDKNREIPYWDRGFFPIVEYWHRDYGLEHKECYESPTNQRRDPEVEPNRQNRNVQVDRCL